MKLFMVTYRQATVHADYGPLSASMKDWNMIQEDFNQLHSQANFFFWVRVLLYLLDSNLLILAKWPQKDIDYGKHQ